MNQTIKKIAIQETYGDRFQHCWGCGPKNEDGLKIKSYPLGDGSGCICEYLPNKEFTGGVPDKLFGGIIAMIFDCHGGASAAWFNHRRKGLELKEDSIIGRYITARLEVDYLSPVPIDKKLIVKSSLEEITDRKAIIQLEMEAEGKLCAKARMVAVPIKSNM